MIALQVLIVSGLAAGGVYGLFAAGHTLIHRLTGMVNFAFGDLVGLGIFVTLLVLAGTAPVTQSGAHEPRFLGALVVGLVVCVSGRDPHVRRTRPAVPRARVDDRLGCGDGGGRVRDPGRDRRGVPALELRLPRPPAVPSRRRRGVHPDRRGAGAGARVLRDRAGPGPRARVGVAAREEPLRACSSSGSRRRGRGARGRRSRRPADRARVRAGRCARDDRGDRGGSGRGGQCQHRDAARAEGTRGRARGSLSGRPLLALCSRGCCSASSSRRSRTSTSAPGSSGRRTARCYRSRSCSPAHRGVAFAGGLGGTGVSALGQTAGELRRAVEAARPGGAPAAWAAVAAVALAALVPLSRSRESGSTRSPTPVYLAVAATASRVDRRARPAFRPSAGRLHGRGRIPPRRCWSPGRAGRSSRPRWPVRRAALVAGLITGGIVRLAAPSSQSGPGSSPGWSGSSCSPSFGLRRLAGADPPAADAARPGRDADRALRGGARATGGHGARDRGGSARGSGLELSALRQGAAARDVAGRTARPAAARRLHGLSVHRRARRRALPSSSRPSPTRRRTTRSCPSSCSSRCCSAGPPRPSGLPARVAALGLIEARGASARAPAAAAAGAVRRRGRGDPARVRPGPRRGGSSRGSSPAWRASASIAKPRPKPPGNRVGTRRMVRRALCSGREELRKAFGGVDRAGRASRSSSHAARPWRSSAVKRLRQDDGAAPDLRAPEPADCRRESSSSGRVLTVEPTAERVRLGRRAHACRRRPPSRSSTALESVLVGRSVRRRYAGAITHRAAPRRTRGERISRQRGDGARDARRSSGSTRRQTSRRPSCTTSQRRLVALAAALATGAARAPRRRARRRSGTRGAGPHRRGRRPDPRDAGSRCCWSSTTCVSSASSADRVVVLAAGRTRRRGLGRRGRRQRRRAARRTSGRTRL